MKVTQYITIKIWDNNAMSVEGSCIGDEKYAVAVLQNAIESIRGHNKPKALIVPEKDVTLPAKG